MALPKEEKSVQISMHYYVDRSYHGSFQERLEQFREEYNSIPPHEQFEHFLRNNSLTCVDLRRLTLEELHASNRS